MKIRISIVGALSAFAILSASSSATAAGAQKSASGKTQVVARLDSREITISDLRGEMARLGLSPNAPDAERIALENLINRILLAKAARSGNFHRQPEAIRRMAAAQEQALADLYVATASQPPEPTRQEINDYIRDNTDLFSRRRQYDFSVLTMPSSRFSQEGTTPLFDETETFAALEKALRKASVEYQITPMTQFSNAFPAAIRKQLAQYGPRDNIVIAGAEETQIFKIMDVRSAPLSSADAAPAARQALILEATQTRAKRILEQLRGDASLAYFRATAAPAPQDAQ